MKRYVAVDPGKYATKCCYVIQNGDEISAKMFKFLTKVSDGDFADDALEPSTMIIGIGETVYKVGRGALREADLSTNKMNDHHRICTLAAIAGICSDDEVDEVHVAIGMPVGEWSVVEKREKYKEFMLPEGVQEIRLMTRSSKTPMVKRFRIVSRYAFPESQGAIFLKRVLDQRKTCSAYRVGVVDIGNLNTNLTMWDNGFMDRGSSSTGELGGNILVSGLSQRLSSEFSRCTVETVSAILRKPHEERKLKPIKQNPDVEENSKHIISEYLLDHVKRIKRQCDILQWDYDFIPLVFIGGTSSILSREIHEVFGDDVYIPSDPEYANVAGFLRVLCSKELNIVIPLPDIEGDEEDND